MRTPLSVLTDSSPLPDAPANPQATSRDMPLGHDFGSVPFGYEAVRQAAEREGHQFLNRRRSDCAVCLLDLYPIADVRCPVHGLEAFLRERLGEGT
jgi:hypothetical protein